MKQNALLLMLIVGFCFKGQALLSQISIGLPRIYPKHCAYCYSESAAQRAVAVGCEKEMINQLTRRIL